METGRCSFTEKKEIEMKTFVLRLVSVFILSMGISFAGTTGDDVFDHSHGTIDPNGISNGNYNTPAPDGIIDNTHGTIDPNSLKEGSGGDPKPPSLHINPPPPLPDPESFLSPENRGQIEIIILAQSDKDPIPGYIPPDYHQPTPLPPNPLNNPQGDRPSPDPSQPAPKDDNGEGSDQPIYNGPYI